MVKISGSFKSVDRLDLESSHAWWRPVTRETISVIKNREKKSSEFVKRESSIASHPKRFHCPQSPRCSSCVAFAEDQICDDILAVTSRPAHWVVPAMISGKSISSSSKSNSVSSLRRSKHRQCSHYSRPNEATLPDPLVRVQRRHWSSSPSVYASVLS